MASDKHRTPQAQDVNKGKSDVRRLSASCSWALAKWERRPGTTIVTDWKHLMIEFLAELDGFDSDSLESTFF
ncbi:MAG TPA: hypothetical protein VF595_11555 [Tepidisphaeraceae bacterium]|jgi:hypothetical protein